MPISGRVSLVKSEKQRMPCQAGLGGAFAYHCHMFDTWFSLLADTGVQAAFTVVGAVFAASVAFVMLIGARWWRL